MYLPATLTRFVEYELHPNQIQDFKTLINRVLKGQVEAFHNHIDGSEQTKMEYPLIQYRSIKTDMYNDWGEKKYFNLAGLYAVGEGVELVNDLLHEIRDSGKPHNLFEFDVEDYATEIKLLDTPQKYKINHWLPLNVAYNKTKAEKIDNYKKWISEMTMHQRVEMLEGIIAGHIIDFCYEIGFKIPDNQLKITLFDYRTLGKVRYPNNDQADIHYEAFDVIYEANIQLPEYLGLGKGKSKGFGWQTQTQFHQLIDRQRLQTYQNQNRQHYGKRNVVR
ncbi:MAG: hypothetical protein MUF45_18795 [Spirosomaceae bacterium]|jgi:hypothetical protein|nr:hypothetical protein [Spirosomataceae bacterium]